MTMTHAIRIHEHGGPEVLRWEKIGLPRPGPGQAVVRHAAIGLNFIDTYHRSGLYPLPLPTVLGCEAAGVVAEVGEGVTVVRAGDRVAYAGGVPGSYAEARLVDATRLVPVPADIEDRLAAAALLKGMTAQYLLRRTFAVGAADTILIHAAAGGVGEILCQWAHHLGARVIGTVSSDAKAILARSHGCDEVLVTGRDDIVARVREFTGGNGVPVVYDSVGGATWETSLDCLRPLGLMVSFGNASGPVPPVSLGILATKGSLFVTRPTLGTYVATRWDLLDTAAEVWDVIRSGAVRVEVRQSWPLAEAEAAHRALEARQTTGSSLLLP